MSTLGDRIKEKRIAAGFSADELAKRIGKNRATVYRYESGDVDIPVSVVGEIALALDASPAYLMPPFSSLAAEASIPRSNRASISSTF